MATPLRIEQRWLMYAVGAQQMCKCLLSPADTYRVMTSMSGTHAYDVPEECPAWLLGWLISGGKIATLAISEVHVAVTAKQINDYAAQLPATVRAELQACRTADRDELDRVAEWCYSPWADDAPNKPGHRDECRHYHPTADDFRTHFETRQRIYAHTSQVVHRALGLDES